MSIDPIHMPPAPAENQPCPAAFESLETLTLLAKRRSTKIIHFAEPGPNEAQVDTLVRLAARVPDHGKLGPWRFVVFDGEGRARGDAALSGAAPERGEHAAGFFQRAPTCVMVVSSVKPHPKIPDWEQTLSSAAACQTLLIAAHAMGFAGCWITEWPAYEPASRAALGLTENERIAGFVFLGTATQAPTERVRADYASRISRF
jgi:nitroreductase